MEDEDDDFTEPASGIYTDISQYLEDKFNMPGSADRVGPVPSLNDFDSYLADRFRD